MVSLLPDQGEETHGRSYQDHRHRNHAKKQKDDARHIPFMKVLISVLNSPNQNQKNYGCINEDHRPEMAEGKQNQRWGQQNGYSKNVHAPITLRSHTRVIILVSYKDHK